MFPLVACVERCQSGQNRISRSAAKSKFVKRCATCHRTWHETCCIRPKNIAVVDPGRTKLFRSKSVQPFERKKRTSKNTCHVPRARGTCNSRLGFFPPLNCVEWHLPGPDRTSCSGAINEFMKLRGTCLWHVPRAKCRRDTQKHSHPDGAYRPTNFEPNSSIGLACSVDDMFFFQSSRGGTLRCTYAWHQSDRNWHDRLSAVPARRTNPRRSRSAQPFVLQV